MRTSANVLNRVAGAALLAAVAVSVLMVSVADARAQAKDWKEIKFPALKSFTIPEPERYVMKNGIVVMLLPDHELPMIDVSARVRTGSRLEPADKVGLAGMVGTVMRTGGAKGKSGDEIDDWLDARGARIETGIGEDSGTASASSLKGDFPDVVQLFADILRAPSFEESKLKVAKSQATAGIARRNDNPMGIMFREASKLVYGADSPYARDTEYATISAITRDDLVAFHGTYFVPNRLLIGVTGDFDGAQMKALLEKVFGDWKKGPEPKDPEAAWSKTAHPGVYRIVKNDMTQSDIIMSHLGIRQDNPDFFAIDVMNQVLSGSFASRLFSNVRTKKGLAYAVRGGMDAEFDHPGTFNVWVTTKTETTGAAIDALLEEVDGIVTHPATEDEVTRAKQGMLNSFIFNYDSKAKILRQQLAYEYYHYPSDFLAKYRQNIEKVTPADVARVAKQYVKKNDLAILVVGKSEGLDKPLDTYGKVTDLDITIPEPAAAPSKVASVPGMSDAQASARGAEIVAKAVDALGGADKIDHVKSVRIVAQNSMMTPRGEMSMKSTVVAALPDRFRQEMSTPGGSVTMVVTPSDSFVNTPMGIQPLPDSRKAGVMKAIARQPFRLLQRRGEKEFTARYEGTDMVDSTKADVVAITLDGETVRYAVDPASGRILRASYKGTGPMGEPGEVISTFSDFRDAGGLVLPYKTKQSVNGESVGSADLEEVSVNVPVDDALFARPAAAASAAPASPGGGSH